MPGMGVTGRTGESGPSPGDRVVPGGGLSCRVKGAGRDLAPRERSVRTGVVEWTGVHTSAQKLLDGGKGGGLPRIRLFGRRGVPGCRQKSRHREY